MKKTYLKTAAFLGALTVLLGALGAHELKVIADEKAIEIFETGVRYQFYHVLALLLVGVIYRKFTNQLVNAAGILFITGICFFCGSLYLLTAMEILKISVPIYVGLLTPLGGLILVAGWICLGLGIKEAKRG